MPHILRNDALELIIDLPFEGYRRPRFDWSGKIASVRYKGIQVSGKERLKVEDETIFGQGLYNEFDIQTALGYDEVERGEWFHKIGVGLLRKESGPYDFYHPYEVSPATFTINADADRIRISCQSARLHGYAYVLEKEIALLPDGFVVRYSLENVGANIIRTQEYNHNFLAFGAALMGPNYTLKLPFVVDQGMFGEGVNPEGKVRASGTDISFSDQPEETFFFGNLSGGNKVSARWALEHTVLGIGLSETVNQPTQAVNLWGERHVISPELFIEIEVAPGTTQTWTRAYSVYQLT